MIEREKDFQQTFVEFYESVTSQDPFPPHFPLPFNLWPSYLPNSDPQCLGSPYLALS